MLNKFERVYPIASNNALEVQLRKVRLCKTLNDIHQLINCNHEDLSQPRINGKYIHGDSLGHIRSTVMAELDAIDNSDLENFDRHAATVLYENLQIVPTQASSGTVWSTLALYIFPDFIFNRFDIKANSSVSRFKGGRRNGLQRLWLRRRVISEQMEDNYEKVLNQDIVQQLVERPSISASHKLVEAILEVIKKQGQGISLQRDFYRSIMKEATILSGLSAAQLLNTDEIIDELSNRINH